ncbi:MAG TPA: hypothetical protein VKW06_08930 [Candidatus Angelobacter sp.]|nr:hypothetical protein [Candidatus Angelobacter sp.]
MHERLYEIYVWATVTGACVALSALLVLIWQTRITRRLAQVATVTADAAKDSAEIAKKALHLAERADIALEAAGLSTGQEIGKSTEVVLRFKNFGRTRANDVTFKVALTAPGVPESTSTLGPLILAAGAEQSVTFNRLVDWLSGETFSRINTGQDIMCFAGDVTYRDVFGVPHTTKYSGTFLPRTRTFMIGDNQGD